MAVCWLLRVTAATSASRPRETPPPSGLAPHILARHRASRTLSTLTHTSTRKEAGCAHLRHLQPNWIWDLSFFAGECVIEPHACPHTQKKVPQNSPPFDFARALRSLVVGPVDPLVQVKELRVLSSSPRQRASACTSIRSCSTSLLRAPPAATASSPRATRPPAVCCLAFAALVCALRPPAARQRRLTTPFR